MANLKETLGRTENEDLTMSIPLTAGEEGETDLYEFDEPDTEKNIHFVESKNNDSFYTMITRSKSVTVINTIRRSVSPEPIRFYNLTVSVTGIAGLSDQHLQEGYILLKTVTKETNKDVMDKIPSQKIIIKKQKTVSPLATLTVHNLEVSYLRVCYYK